MQGGFEILTIVIVSQTYDVTIVKVTCKGALNSMIISWMWKEELCCCNVIGVIAPVYSVLSIPYWETFSIHYALIQVWINQGDIILIGLRDYQDAKADVILRYNPDEARNLKAYGELPETGREKLCVCSDTTYWTFSEVMCEQIKEWCDYFSLAEKSCHKHKKRSSLRKYPCDLKVFLIPLRL